MNYDLSNFADTFIIQSQEELEKEQKDEENKN